MIIVAKMKKVSDLKTMFKNQNRKQPLICKTFL